MYISLSLSLSLFQAPRGHLHGLRRAMGAVDFRDRTIRLETVIELKSLNLICSSVSSCRKKDEQFPVEQFRDRMMALSRGAHRLIHDFCLCDLCWKNCGSAHKLKLRPISLLRLSLLRLLDSNFPGNSPWAWEFHPLNSRLCLSQTL